MFVDDYNIINIIPYHSTPSLVLIKYVDLSFLLFIAANKYLKKLFDCTFVITPKCILWFVVMFIFWLYFLFFFYYFCSIHFGSAFWLTNKFHFLTCVFWCALFSVCHLTNDGWREHIVLWKWFARSGEIGYQWRIWGNYFSWQSLSCQLRIAWTMLLKLNIFNVLYVVEYKAIPIWLNHLCFFLPLSIDSSTTLSIPVHWLTISPTTHLHLDSSNLNI